MYFYDFQDWRLFSDRPGAGIDWERSIERPPLLRAGTTLAETHQLSGDRCCLIG